MKATLRQMGNSRGVLLPKALLEQLDVDGELEMTVENGAIVLRKPEAPSQDELDAKRFRKLCALLNAAYDGNEVEHPTLTAYCTMQSGWRDERTVYAQLYWKDARDEPLNLAAALDAIPD